MEGLSVIDEEYDIISEIKNSNLNKREQIINIQNQKLQK